MGPRWGDLGWWWTERKRETVSWSVRRKEGGADREINSVISVSVPSSTAWCLDQKRKLCINRSWILPPTEGAGGFWDRAQSRHQILCLSILETLWWSHFSFLFFDRALSMVLYCISLFLAFHNSLYHASMIHTGGILRAQLRKATNF